MYLITILYSGFFTDLSATILLPLVNHQKHVSSFRRVTFKARLPISTYKLQHQLFTQQLPLPAWVKGWLWFNKTRPQGRMDGHGLGKHHVNYIPVFWCWVSWRNSWLNMAVSIWLSTFFILMNRIRHLEVWPVEHYYLAAYYRLSDDERM